MVQAELTDYEVRERIGRGSFGEVFVVIHKATKKKLVLKRVRLARQNEWQRAASRFEMELAQQLAHPFVVPHFESWVDRGHTINMVHEFCSNGDLASLLKRLKGALVPEGQLKLWLAQALLALEYLHCHGVVHRDLKNGNLFLNASGDVLLGDFGLAARRGTGSEDEDHALVGTPHYMSPELLSSKEYSFQTDVWSLGCCMWELCAHRPAFQAFNFDGLTNKIRKGSLGALPSQYSREWTALLKSMLVKNPSKRASVGGLLSSPCMADAMQEAMGRYQELAAKLGITGSQHLLRPLHSVNRTEPADDYCAAGSHAGESPGGSQLGSQSGSHDFLEESAHDDERCTAARSAFNAATGPKDAAPAALESQFSVLSVTGRISPGTGVAATTGALQQGMSFQRQDRKTIGEHASDSGAAERSGTSASGDDDEINKIEAVAAVRPTSLGGAGAAAHARRSLCVSAHATKGCGALAMKRSEGSAQGLPRSLKEPSVASLQLGGADCKRSHTAGETAGAVPVAENTERLSVGGLAALAVSESEASGHTPPLHVPQQGPVSVRIDHLAKADSQAGLHEPRSAPLLDAHRVSGAWTGSEGPNHASGSSTPAPARSSDLGSVPGVGSGEAEHSGGEAGALASALGRSGSMHTNKTLIEVTSSSGVHAADKRWGLRSLTGLRSGCKEVREGTSEPPAHASETPPIWQKPSEARAQSRQSAAHAALIAASRPLPAVPSPIELGIRAAHERTGTPAARRSSPGRPRRARGAPKATAAAARPVAKSSKRGSGAISGRLFRNSATAKAAGKAAAGGEDGTRGGTGSEACTPARASCCTSEDAESWCASPLVSSASPGAVGRSSIVTTGPDACVRDLPSLVKRQGSSCGSVPGDAPCGVDRDRAEAESSSDLLQRLTLRQDHFVCEPPPAATVVPQCVTRATSVQTSPQPVAAIARATRGSVRGSLNAEAASAIGGPEQESSRLRTVLASALGLIQAGCVFEAKAVLRSCLYASEAHLADDAGPSDSAGLPADVSAALVAALNATDSTARVGDREHARKAKENAAAARATAMPNAAGVAQQLQASGDRAEAAASAAVPVGYETALSEGAQSLMLPPVSPKRSSMQQRGRMPSSGLGPDWLSSGNWPDKYASRDGSVQGIAADRLCTETTFAVADGIGRGSLDGNVRCGYNAWPPAGARSGAEECETEAFAAAAAGGHSDDASMGSLWPRVAEPHGVQSTKGALEDAMSQPRETTGAQAQVGDLVVLGDRHRVHATVRYVGPVHGYEAGLWVGLELSEPRGAGDGSVQGHVYFDCAPQHGLFVQASRLAPDE